MKKKKKRIFRRVKKVLHKDKRREGICSKCGKKKSLTKHHVLPQRHYHGTGKVILLCRKCHNNMEKFIQYRERLVALEYYEIYEQFINDDFLS